jgi:pyrimidine-specific ribonucleoside hydrolase
MGGSIGLGNVTPAAEFNIWADPEAAAQVFASGIELTMIGLDVTHQALLMTEDAERLRASGRTGRMVAELFDFFHRFHRDTYGFGGSPIHDALAVAYAFRPQLVHTEHRHVAIECESELTRGRTVVDLWRRTGAEPDAHVGVDVDGRAFIELVLERLPTLDAR